MRELFKKKSFFCFTPEVMIATFAIEIILAIYVYFRYKATRFVKISIFLLILLSLFQFAEFNVCGGSNILTWSRFGFFVITIIPVLGMELISTITKRRYLFGLAYSMMFVFLFIFIFIPESMISAVCKGNYIMFESTLHGIFDITITYSIYYFGFLFFGIWEVIEEYLKIKEVTENNETKKELLIWMLIGYLSFMVPTGIVFVITQMGIDIIPSVLCGFAVLLAVILAFKIVPLAKKLGL